MARAIRQNVIPAAWTRPQRAVAIGILAAALAAAPSTLSAQDAEPPAQAEAEEQPETRRNERGDIIVNIVNSDAKIEVVLSILNQQTAPVRVIAYGRVVGERVTVFATDTPLETALDMIARQKGWTFWKQEDGNYGLAERAYFEQEVLPKRFVQKVFQPKNLKASELLKAVQDMLTKGGANGSAVADDRTNKLIVNDLPPVMERIERLIREIDVQLITRVFQIQHADVTELAQKIESYKSGPGTIELDAKTRQIIVTDLLANIKKMELMIDILDVGPEIVIYDVNNIGIDGKDLESLQKIIDSIRTEELLFEVNAKQGVFILEDVASVQEKVEQILASFDQPVKQVQIQGEIVSTSFNRNFGFGIDRFAIAPDLLGAIRGGSVPPPTGVSDGDLADPNLGFTNIYQNFPNLNFSGDRITGQALGNSVYLSASAVFSDTRSNILLQPNLLVKNQESSRLFVGAETPFLSTIFNDNTTGTGTRTQTQQTVQDGLELEITPSIANSFLIELDININNDKAFQAGENQGITLIGRNRQNIETILQVPSGQTRVIGGLITDSATRGSKGLPFLSSLPIIGALFGSKTNTTDRTNLMLFITPTVVEDTIPRPTGTDGRRGRLVSEYKEFSPDLELSPEARAKIARELEQAEGDPDADDGDLLSGDGAERERILKTLRQGMPDEAAEEELFEGSNYTPRSGGTGGASINTGNGAAPGGQPGQPEQSGPRVRPRPRQPAGTDTPVNAGQPSQQQVVDYVPPTINPPRTETRY